MTETPSHDISADQDLESEHETIDLSTWVEQVEGITEEGQASMTVDLLVAERVRAEGVTLDFGGERTGNESEGEESTLAKLVELAKTRRGQVGLLLIFLNQAMWLGILLLA